MSGLPAKAVAPSGLAPKCRYCDGRGGSYRYVYSRFLGTDAQAHQGPWELCSFCKGSGVQNQDTKP